MKKINFIKFQVIFLCTGLLYSVFSHAQSCEQYPYSDGMSIENVNGGVKIIATGSASVSSNDRDSVRDAKEEATLEAKAIISKFFNEDMKSDSSIKKVVNETKSMQGDQKSNTRNETIERIKSLQNSSQSLLKGVVMLGDCYTKGDEVRVSVGLKPESIATAKSLSDNINSSNTTLNPNSKSSNTRQSNGSISSPIVEKEGYSNSERFNKF
jgi:hypothetical protein